MLKFPDATFPNEKSRTYTLTDESIDEAFDSFDQRLGGKTPRPYGEADATMVVLASPLHSAECYDPDADFLSAQRECISTSLSGVSIEQWTEQRHPNEWFTPRECSGSSY